MSPASPIRLNPYETDPDRRAGAGNGAVDAWPEDQVRRVIALVRRNTGFDFSDYRCTTVRRRIRNRMMSLGAESLPGYIELLQERPEEAGLLVERLTIKVSRFYRNPDTFDFLRDVVLPSLARTCGDRPMRIWSAGCGHGEEPWTLAMLLEQAGIAGEVLASDIDAAALEQAGRASYGAEAVQDLPADLRKAYLEPGSGSGQAHYHVRQDLRSRVKFLVHDVTACRLPEPDCGFDLVCCRNVLIYLARPVQLRVVEFLRGAVPEGGYLCLGEAEWPLSPVSQSLQSMGRNTHVFRAVTERGIRQ